MRILSSLSVVLVVAGLAAEARAQSESDVELAETLFREGVELVEAGRIEAALASFQRSYELNQVNIVLYNIGTCQRSLGRLAEALGSFERYLEAGGDRIPEERRQMVEAAIAELRAEVGEAEEPEEPEAPEEPEEPPPSEASPDPAGSPEPEPERVGVHRRWWFWTIVAGVVAAGVGLGLGLGLDQNPDPPEADFPVSLP